VLLKPSPEVLAPDPESCGTVVLYESKGQPTRSRDGRRASSRRPDLLHTGPDCCRRTDKSAPPTSLGSSPTIPDLLGPRRGGPIQTLSRVLLEISLPPGHGNLPLKRGTIGAKCSRHLPPARFILRCVISCLLEAWLTFPDLKGRRCWSTAVLFHAPAPGKGCLLLGAPPEWCLKRQVQTAGFAFAEALWFVGRDFNRPSPPHPTELLFPNGARSSSRALFQTPRSRIRPFVAFRPCQNGFGPTPIFLEGFTPPVLFFTEALRTPATGLRCGHAGLSNALVNFAIASPRLGNAHAASACVFPTACCAGFYFLSFISWFHFHSC